MAAELETPVCEATGLPLPIAPSEQSNDASARRDWHHHFHPRLSPLLAHDSLSGSAVRSARIQLVDYATHHNDYHGNYLGPPLPVTETDKFGLVILATAGYIPREGLDFSGNEPKRVELSHEQRKRMRGSGELKVAAISPIQKFITAYTMDQDLSHVDEMIIDEFLNTTDKEQKLKLGSSLLRLAVRQAADPIIPMYRQAWKNGLIDQQVPSKAQRFVRSKINFKKRGVSLTNQLDVKFRAA